MTFSTALVTRDKFERSFSKRYESRPSASTNSVRITLNNRWSGRFYSFPRHTSWRSMGALRRRFVLSGVGCFFCLLSGALGVGNSLTPHSSFSIESSSNCTMRRLMALLTARMTNDVSEGFTFFYDLYLEAWMRKFAFFALRTKATEIVDTHNSSDMTVLTIRTMFTKASIIPGTIFDFIFWI